MAQWLNRQFERAPKKMVAACGSVPTGVLSDCMNRFQAMDAAIRPLVPGMKCVGSAFTVQAMESCNWGAHQALALAKPGDVLVIAARGSALGAVWGHVMTLAATRKGIAGVVLDGCVRDVEENRRELLPIFCRGICPGGPHKGWPCNLNVPVSCAGVAVLPGDIVVGDEDGVVVVPCARATQVLAEARKKLETEKDWKRRVAAGEDTPSLLGLERV